MIFQWINYDNSKYQSAEIIIQFAKFNRCNQVVHQKSVLNINMLSETIKLKYRLIQVSKWQINTIQQLDV